jgi:hypothetical protein
MPKQVVKKKKKEKKIQAGSLSKAKEVRNATL